MQGSSTREPMSLRAVGRLTWCRTQTSTTETQTMSLAIADKTVLVTGANRGLGRALVDEALRRGAKRVYAASRQPMVVTDERVTPLTLDVTDRAQIQEAVDSVESLDILINNAGVSVADDLSDRSAFEQHLAVNLYGTLDVTQALLPSLTRSRGAVVNVVSLGAVAAVPVLPAYSVSKAASLSVTQSLRALLARQGVRVYAVMPGPIDTDMVRALEIPKTPPEDVARATLDGVERGEEEIFPDPLSQSLADGWRAGVAKDLERQNAAMVQAEPSAA
jgi:NAD(P)-dependent dehydrogenase (short-subunit alcohol dehydrogenase family)